MTHVTTEHGTLDGAVEDGLHVFRAVPYAAPPFGPRRFLPPRPPEKWDGVRDATRAGVIAPQPVTPDDPLAPLFAPTAATPMGEDCLTLEVWTPDPGAAGLPVVVHIHGGGYLSGSGSFAGYSGRAFARDGVVHVGINYRVGIDGFLHLGDGHDNLGLRDQQAALEWVRRNIAAFGGDPDRVTILGQSGGAVSVMSQLTMPGSRGLFARAVAQSGCSMASVDADEATRVTRMAARRLGVPATPEGFASVSLERPAATAQWLMVRFVLGFARGDARSLLLSPFRAVHGTELLPSSPVDAAAASDVPLLAGTVRNETVGFIDALRAIPVLGALALRGLRRTVGLDRALADAYRTGRGLTDRVGLAEAAWSDWGFRIPTIRLVEARTAPSWLYEFRWESTAGRPGLSSFHGVEIPFTRDDLALVEQLPPGDPRAVRGRARRPGHLHARGVGGLRDHRRSRLARLRHRQAVDDVLRHDARGGRRRRRCRTRGVAGAPLTGPLWTVRGGGSACVTGGTVAGGIVREAVSEQDCRCRRSVGTSTSRGPIPCARAHCPWR